MSDPLTFVPMIKGADRRGIEDAITDSKVEGRVLERLRAKAEMYGADPNFDFQAKGKGEGEEGLRKVSVEGVVAMYRDFVIPLTKVVEVEYLMVRLRGSEWE